MTACAGSTELVNRFVFGGGSSIGCPETDVYVVRDNEGGSRRHFTRKSSSCNSNQLVMGRRFRLSSLAL